MIHDYFTGRVLTIAGSDSGGGAGIQADIKTITALGGYAASAITALTAQNTQGVFGIHEVPLEFIRQQITLVLDDIGADAIKTGMLHKAEVIEVVADVLGEWYLAHSKIPSPSTTHQAPGTWIPLIVDPVMVAKGGAPLLESEAIDTMKTKLFPFAAIVTPNIPEAELLSGIRIDDPDGMTKAAERILAFGPQAVLIKGGHLKGEHVVDILCSAEGMERFESKRIDTNNTHGTGCTLASAIAIGLAKKMDLFQAVERARNYVQEAIRTAHAIGRGHGPLNHGHTVKPF